MKVAVLIDTWFPFIGGGQINAWEISKNLALRGVKIDIITRNNGKYKDVKFKNLRVIKLGKDSPAGNNVSKMLFTINALLFLFKNNYDIIHSHAFLPGITARLIMVFKGIPSVLTVHGTSINSNLNGAFSKIIEKFILTKILYSTQITVSRDFLEIKNINKKIVYIPNGVDVNKYTTKKIRRNGLLCVARLHPQKNLINLISAIKILKSKYKNIKLTIAGDGPQKRELQQFIKKHKLQENVILAGVVIGKDLADLYCKSELFVLPSIYEGQPISILEAFAAKTPIVASKTGDIPFLVQDGENGYLFIGPQNPRNIAQTIERARNNKKLSELGARGYRLVKKNYTWELAAKKTYDVYKNIVIK